MKKSKIENLKTVTILILFAVTILLLNLLWPGDSESIEIADFFKLGKTAEEEISLDPYFCAESAVITNTDGTMTLAEDTESAQAIFLSCIKTGCEDASAAVVEINKVQYEEAISLYESVILRFSYEFPFSEYISEFSVKKGSGFDSVGNINVIMYSLAAEDSFFACNTAEDKYYRIICSGNLQIAENIKENCKLYDTKYYSSRNLFGLESELKLPVAASPRVTPTKYIPYYMLESEEDREKFAKNIFGDVYDFVRKSKDSEGNISYMYGYGQKIVNLYADGTYEYKGESGTDKNTGFFEDLRTAIEFMDNSSDLSLGSEKYKYVLACAEEEITAKTTKRTFCFAQYMNGVIVVHDDASFAITAEVENGVVSYYSKLAVKIGISTVDDSLGKEASVVLADNARLLESFEEGLSENPDYEEAFKKLCENIESINMQLYEAEGYMLNPCWVFTLKNGDSYLFDYYSGKYIGRQ